MKVMLNCTVLILFLCLSAAPLCADGCTGWRDFRLSGEEGFSDGVFTVGELRFLRTGDVKAELKIKNIGSEEARAAVSIGLFDSRKLLLTSISISSRLLPPGITDRISEEFLGSAEVLPQIKYYQLSIIERGEK